MGFTLLVALTYPINLIVVTMCESNRSFGIDYFLVTIGNDVLNNKYN